jgi:hypothetical protein
MTGTEPITAGFPSSTATSLAAVGTGLPTGEHGIVGSSFAVSDSQLLDALGWRAHGTRHRVDLREKFVPEEVQPRPTAFQRAVDAGVHVRIATAPNQNGSGLSRAVLRGGEFRGVFALGDLAAEAVSALNATERVFCYAYHSELDLLGHVYGPGSEPWRLQLRHVDQLAASIAEGLPSDGLLAITADHGMVRVGVDDRIDFDTDPRLAEGVRLLGGEPRVRHVYTGAVDDVRAAWHEVLGDRAWIVRREEAIDLGWFGPRVADHVRARIGDLVVAAHGNTAIVRSTIESKLAKLVGQHGSLTADEQLIPFLLKVT